MFLSIFLKSEISSAQKTTGSFIKTNGVFEVLKESEPAIVWFWNILKFETIIDKIKIPTKALFKEQQSASSVVILKLN